MFLNHKSTNKYLALFAFITSLIIYVLTMAPTASFWDAGEFIAVAHGLQVNHPQELLSTPYLVGLHLCSCP